MVLCRPVLHLEEARGGADPPDPPGLLTRPGQKHPGGENFIHGTKNQRIFHPTDPLILPLIAKNVVHLFDVPTDLHIDNQRQSLGK